MSGSIPSDDDSDGDLGLGDGLKPGALPNIHDPLSEYCFQSSNENATGSASTSNRQNGQCEYTQLSRVSDVDSEDETDSDSDSDFELSLMPIKPIQELKANYSSKEPSKRSTETFPQDPPEQKAFGNCLLDCDLKEPKSKTFPVFADVPYGTSIRQQKELFNQNIEDLRIKHGTLSMTDQSGSRSSSKYELDGKKIIPNAVCLNQYDLQVMFLSVLAINSEGRTKIGSMSCFYKKR